MFNKYDIIYSDVRRERYIVLLITDKGLKAQRRCGSYKKFDNIINITDTELEDDFFKLAKLI